MDGVILEWSRARSFTTLLTYIGGWTLVLGQSLAVLEFIYGPMDHLIG